MLHHPARLRSCLVDESVQGLVRRTAAFARGGVLFKRRQVGEEAAKMVGTLALDGGRGLGSFGELLVCETPRRDPLIGNRNRLGC